MPSAKATVSVHTDEHQCPVLEGTAKAQYKAAVAASNDFSLACLRFLDGRTPEDKMAWIRASVMAGRDVFTPWSLEIIYAIAVMGTARFSDLLGLLGLSSRTLSDKLKALKDGGFVERQVFDESPVRVEYRLSRRGKATAALASPLFARLNLETLHPKAA